MQDSYLHVISKRKAKRLISAIIAALQNFSAFFNAFNLLKRIEHYPSLNPSHLIRLAYIIFNYLLHTLIISTRF